jgi:tight adherence protein B
MNPAAFTPIIYVAAFLAVVLLIQALTSFFFTASASRGRVNRRLSMLESGMRSEDVYAALVRTRHTLRSGDQRIDNFYENIFTYAHQAGLGLTPVRLTAITGGLAVVIWLISLVFLRQAQGSGFIVDGTLSAIGACVIACLGVYVWVTGRRNARLKLIEQQLPLALDIVNRAIRAGHPVVSAVQLAANEMGDPIGSEFGLIVDETTYGQEFKDALKNFADRTGSPDAHFFAVSVGIQSETGGNLGEILEGLAQVIRGRINLAKKVKALASEGRMSAYILSALPIFVIGFLMIIAPSFYTTKMGDPVFWPTVAVVIILYIVGWIMIQRIVNFKY